MSNNKPIRRVAIIGTGVIGASWSAQFLAKGLDVIATDIAPDAETSLRRFVKAAWPALERLGLAPGASQSRLTFTADLPAAVRAAEFIQENGPERIDFKQKLYRQLDELLSADVIIASSSSGLTMSAIQSACDLHPERWGIMGNMMLNHLGGGQGGIEHFFQQFTGPMTAWWKVLGQPVLTPEVQKKLIDSVHAEVGSRSIAELEAQRDEVLLGLLELRSKAEKTPATPKAAARAG